MYLIAHAKSAYEKHVGFAVPQNLDAFVNGEGVTAMSSVAIALLQT
jgi:hypothetical protein